MTVVIANNHEYNRRGLVEMTIEIFVVENAGFNSRPKGFKITTLGAKRTLRETFYEENYVSRP